MCSILITITSISTTHAIAMTHTIAHARPTMNRDTKFSHMDAVDTVVDIQVAMEGMEDTEENR